MLRRLSPRIVVVLGYVCLALAFSWPLPLHLDTALTGDTRGDTGVYVWNQWVFHHEAVVERRNPFTTEHVLSLTATVDLSQHNYTVFLNLLALPLIPWLGMVHSFNVVYLAITVLTALMTYALVRRVTSANRAEAWLAGVAFAWTPFLVARSISHFSLVAAAPLPAFVLCLIRANRTRRVRDAALTGLCMAWAAFCDPYFAVYCLLIVGCYVISRLVGVHWSVARAPALLRWTLDILIVSIGGLIVGLIVSGGGRFTVLGIAVSMRGLYTPVFILTLLVTTRVLLTLRPHVEWPAWRWSPSAARALLVGVIACAGPLSPVLYGLGERILDGRLSRPETLWRSSPRGVDLLGFFEFNPNNPIARAVYDKQLLKPNELVDYTASLSLVALVVIGIAIWRVHYRPRVRWLWLTLGFAALALGPFVYVAGVNTHVPGPWALLRYVPLVDAARAPTRFAVVVALGVAVLFAGALAALGRKYPRHRARLTLVIGAALLFELSPAPRTLYSAEMPSVYDIIAADPRPVRVLQLPFGVRDGTFGVGNFSARYLYYQTKHEKRLIGGYLSRISRRRVQEVRSQPTLDALILLSEGGSLPPHERARVRARGPRFIRRSNVGYVVINHATSPPQLVDFAFEAWGLREIAREGATVLYLPTAGQAAGPSQAPPR